MEGTLSRLAAHIVGVHHHLARVAAQSDRNQPGLDWFGEPAANGAGKIRLRLALERNLPGYRVFVVALQLTGVDHVTSGNRAISLDHAGQTLLKLGHRVPPKICPQTAASSPSRLRTGLRPAHECNLRYPDGPVKPLL